MIPELDTLSAFEYLVTLVSIIAGLALTRALVGLAKIVQLRNRVHVSGVHLAWTISLILWLISFWWFTYLLGSLKQWAPPLLLFELLYGAVIFFLLALLYPENLGSQTDLLEFFLSNRRFFFGAFVVLGVLDTADTMIKYQLGLGLPPLPQYYFLATLWIGVGAAGFFTSNRICHRVLAYAWLAVVVYWFWGGLFTVTGSSSPEPVQW